MHHNQLWTVDAGELPRSRFLENSFGYDGHYYLCTLPFVRHFFVGGHFSVSVFFVISGYVLTNKPLSLLQKGDTDGSAASVSSALFRRWFRLFIPVFASMFAYICIWHFTGWWVAATTPAPHFAAELYQFTWEGAMYSSAFQLSWSDPFLFCRWYNFHLWSIPIEFKGSLIVYVAVTALSRVTQEARLWGELGLLGYFVLVIDGWYGALFMSGVILADLELLNINGKLPRWIKELEPHKTKIFTTLFIISMYLGGVPSHENKPEVLKANPGWYLLSYLRLPSIWDQKWYFLVFAATFLVASVPRLPWLKAFFETRFCQYLGRISFALYLMHGPVLWTLGDRVYAAAGWVRESHAVHYPGWANAIYIPEVGPMGFTPRFWICQLILIPFTFWMSEVVTALLDEPSVKLANRWYQYILDEPQKAASKA